MHGQRPSAASASTRLRGINHRGTSTVTLEVKLHERHERERTATPACEAVAHRLYVARAVAELTGP